MNLYVRNNKFWFELENLTRLFFPNEKINVFKDDTPLELPYICAEQGECITVSVRIGDFAAEKTAPVSADDNSNELSMVKLLYVILRDFSGVDQPWGGELQSVRRRAVLPDEVQLLFVRDVLG